MSKQLIIQACKCTLVLGENELFNGLKPELLAAALRRGKAYKRAAISEKRQAHVGSSKLCDWLKGRGIPNNASSLVETMSINELRKGCSEYLLIKLQEGGTTLEV